MNEINTRKLFTDFDRLFRGRTEPGTQTRMCDGFACGDGWFDLIYQLCVQITEYAQKNGLDPKAMQVKEKFGTLRFYMDGTDEVVDTMAEEAGVRSGTICEGCGAQGENKNRHNWYSTLCSQCEDKLAKRAKALKRLPYVPAFRRKKIKPDRRREKKIGNDDEPPF